MNVLTVEALRKSYGMKPLLEAVTFGLGDDEKMGLLGANGSGKTTLMRIIAGVETPDRGRVRADAAHTPAIGARIRAERTRFQAAGVRPSDGRKDRCERWAGGLPGRIQTREHVDV